MSVELNHTIVGATDKPGEINTRRGGRGLYFHDPEGPSMELLTRAP